jgi:CubicO group peptidase (beta-lactamase class C family)
MARFGYLYHGRWGDTQIVSEEWVERSTSSLTQLDTELGYGYQWWIMPGVNAYRASGLYGQQIFVAPDENIVLVFTAHITPTQHALEESLFEEYVLDAIITEEETWGGIPGFPMPAILVSLTAFYVLLRYKNAA